MVKGFTGKTLLIISQSAPLFPMTAEGAFPNQGPISKLGQAEGRTGGQLTNQIRKRWEHLVARETCGKTSSDALSG